MSDKSEGLLYILVGILLLAFTVVRCNRAAHGQEANPSTKVTCGGGPEHTINFVPVSRSGQRVATCRQDQKETRYDNATTERWRYFTDSKGLFVIRIAWLNQDYPDQFYGPIRPGVALERLEFHPGGAAVPPQMIYKPTGGKLTVLNARSLAEVNRDLDSGKEGK